MIKDFLLKKMFFANKNNLSKENENLTEENEDPNPVTKNEGLIKINENERGENVVLQQKVNELIEMSKEMLGNGLLLSVIWATADGQPIANFNAPVKASALFNQITQGLDKALQGSEFPKLGNYYVVDMADSALGVVISMGAFQWGLIVDKTKTTLGLLLNVAMPEMIDAFKETIKR